MAGARSGETVGDEHQLRVGWLSVLGPLAFGLALSGLALWAGLVYAGDQAFAAHAVSAAAVVDRVYDSTPSIGGYGESLRVDQYAMVHFAAHGKAAHARVLLAAQCVWPCPPQHKAGDELTVYYSPQNLSYAQLSPYGPPAAALIFGSGIFGLLALIFLFAAAVNGFDHFRLRR